MKYSVMNKLVCMAMTLAGPSACVGSLSSGDDPSAGSADAKSCPMGAIDDLEDGNQQITVHDGRAGYWYTFADEDGTTIAPDGEFETTDLGAAGSKRAARIAGHTADGKNVWAGMAFGFANPKLPYDASKYRGIAFYARHAKGTTPVVKVRLSDTNTDPMGGKCKECWNDFGAQLVLTPEWKRYVLLFDEIAQEPGWGEQKEAVNAKELLELKWQIGTRNVDYDIWIDGIEFVGCK